MKSFLLRAFYRSGDREKNLTFTLSMAAEQKRYGTSRDDIMLFSPQARRNSQAIVDKPWKYHPRIVFPTKNGALFSQSDPVTTLVACSIVPRYGKLAFSDQPFPTSLPLCGESILQARENRTNDDTFPK